MAFSMLQHEATPREGRPGARLNPRAGSKAQAAWITSPAVGCRHRGARLHVTYAEGKRNAGRGQTHV
ncbi:unnamed protein product [Boreogadus saida]